MEVGKALDQEYRDRNRKSYRLVFPADMSADQVVAWLRAMSGTLRSKHFLVSGSPTVVFEMWATQEGISHILKVPWQHADYIINEMRSHLPAVRYSPEKEFPRRVWTRAVELGLRHSSRRLSIPVPADLSASLLGSVQPVDKHETIVMQWVVTPAIPLAPPVHKQAASTQAPWQMLLNGNEAGHDEVNDRRAKLDEPNFMGVLRIGAVATTRDRADHLLFRVRAALNSARSPTVRFEKRLLTANQLQNRLDKASGSVHFPARLSLTELTALLAWPIGSLNFRGLPQALARIMPAVVTVPSEGRVIGRSNEPGNERPVAIAYDQAVKHLHVVGPTGVGKTVLLANMLKQDVEHGYGVVLIENKGDLFHAALDYIPRERLQDVIVLDVNDTRFPVGFNVLRQGDPAVVVDELNLLFAQLFKDNPSLWMQEVMYHGLHTLLTNPHSTFIDLAALISPLYEERAWRDQLTRDAKDPQLRSFWQRFDNQPPARRDQIAQPVMSRIWPMSRSKLRNIIGQSESSFQMADVVRENKILLVNLSGIEREAATLMGTLIMNALWHAIKTTPSDRATFLYLDEFQDFMNLPIDAADMLAKARSMGLGMTLAHQHPGQLPNEMRDAIDANARSKVVFQSSADGAHKMARAFGNAISDQDLMNLGRYEAMAKVATHDGVSPPLTMATLKPERGYGLSRDVIEASRQAYGRPLAEVQEEITRRHAADQVPGRRKPNIGNVPA